MLEKAEYLRFKKRGILCALCGASLLDAERHPSMLIEPVRTSPSESDEIASPVEAPLPGDVDTRAPTALEGVGPDAPPSDDPQGTPGNHAPLDSPPPDPQTDKTAPMQPAEETDESGFQRFDFCDKCWAAKKDKAFFCFWVGRRAPSDLPPKKLNRAERNLALLALFDSLAEKNGDENDYTPHLFFLAHLLMKFRIFKWQPAATDPETGAKMLCFLRADTPDPVLIPDTSLEDETIVRLKDEIESYLLESAGQAIRL